MQITFARVALGTAVLMTLSNCAAVEKIEKVQEFAGVALDASQSRNRVLGNPLIGIDPLPGTSFDAMPMSGEAVFKGAAYVAATSDTGGVAGFSLVGRSEVIVDFEPGAENLRGTLSDFQATSNAGGILDASGTLQLHDGVIGEERPNAFTVDYSGDLDVSGDAFELSGGLEGGFRGTRTEPNPGQSTVRALSATDTDGIVQGDSQTFRGSVAVIAEN